MDLDLIMGSQPTSEDHYWSLAKNPLQNGWEICKVLLKGITGIQNAIGEQIRQVSPYDLAVCTGLKAIHFVEEIGRGILIQLLLPQTYQRSQRLGLESETTESTNPKAWDRKLPEMGSKSWTKGTNGSRCIEPSTWYRHEPFGRFFLY